MEGNYKNRYKGPSLIIPTKVLYVIICLTIVLSFSIGYVSGLIHEKEIIKDELNILLKYNCDIKSETYKDLLNYLSNK